ncbi:MAG: hypothetical protein HEQ32_00880 [Vampirovibrio sp.]
MTQFQSKITLSLMLMALLFQVTAHAAAPLNSSMIKPITVSSTQLVKEPSTYLKKQVAFTGVIAGFSALGLNYPPIKHDVKDYVTLLLYRADVPPQYEIPLSELKIFVNRRLLKNIKRIGQGDTVKVTGTIISTALGDAWLEASQLTVIKSVQEADKNLDDE